MKRRLIYSNTFLNVTDLRRIVADLELLGDPGYGVPEVIVDPKPGAKVVGYIKEIRIDRHV